MNKTVSSLKAQRNWMPREDLDTLLEEKDCIIAELKERIAFLSSELKRQDAILARIAEGVDEPLPSRAPEAADGPQALIPRGARDTQAPDVRQRQDNSERPALPKGYRVVATASDAWVLVAPRGLRVAGYRGELDLWKAAQDAHEHHQRG